MDTVIEICKEHICLFCGQPKQVKYDEYTQYHECDCEDSITTRKILAEIDALKRKLPREKFEVVTKHHLIDKK